MLTQLLKSIEIFSSLDDTSLAVIQQLMKPVHLKAGEIICREGEPGQCMFVLETGVISVLKYGKDNVLVEITTLRPGEMAGIMSLFGNENRSATMQASTDVTLWEIQHADFQRLIESNPAIAQNMLRVLSRYLREEIQVVAELRTHDIDNRLKVALFDAKPYTQSSFMEQNNEVYALKFFESRLSADTAILANGFPVVCAFVNDTLDEAVIKKLSQMGVSLIAMRCAGYNNVDLRACREHHISVTHVPAYSPHAVAEHAVALMMTLNRRINRAHNRVREGNFSLNGLVGFDMFGKTAGIIGSGKIGQCVIDILSGFGCTVLVHQRSPLADTRPNVRQAGLDELYAESDIISLHAPLVPDTRHMINEQSIAKMKTGVMIINTSRGGLVDSQALINALVSGKVGSAGLDVYEEEKDYFFEDYSDMVLRDENLARLTTFNNVIMTGHMAFLTREALLNIAESTLGSIREFHEGKRGDELTFAIKAHP